MITEMFCGKWGAAQCTGERLFDYLGDWENNEHTPMGIRYHYTEPGDILPPGITPLDHTAQRCSAQLQVNYLLLCEIFSYHNIVYHLVTFLQLDYFLDNKIGIIYLRI